MFFKMGGSSVYGLYYRYSSKYYRNAIDGVIIDCILRSIRVRCYSRYMLYLLKNRLLFVKQPLRTGSPLGQLVLFFLAIEQQHITNTLPLLWWAPLLSPGARESCFIISLHLYDRRIGTVSRVLAIIMYIHIQYIHCVHLTWFIHGDRVPTKKE